MTAPTSDGEYLKEANAQRAHELALEKVQADKEKELARLANQRASERRTWLGFFFAALAVVVLVGALISWGIWNTSKDKQLRQQQSEKQAEVAKECIAAGNIWLNGSCLITGKAK